jgi:hypothetical protein
MQHYKGRKGSSKKGRVKTVKVDLIPTLEEFLRDVVRMQRKYVGSKKDIRSLRFTAVLHDGNINDPYHNVTEKTVPGAIAAALRFGASSKPKSWPLRVIVRVRLKGCSFDQSVPCAIGKPLVEAAAKALGLVHKADYSC